MNTIANNLLNIKRQIQTIAQDCDRDPKKIELIAVSKTKPVNQILEAIDAGQRIFGENYVQEGIEKIQYFKQYHPAIPLQWHFIGPLQSNKSKLVAEHFDWFHTLDRYKIAKRLNDQRPAHLLPLNILIQINIDQESTKSGIATNEITALIEQVVMLPQLKIRGLMAIPEATHDFDRQLATFEHMHTLLQHFQSQYPFIDTLSMGMSGDMKSAIIAGSNMVRIGTAIFGTR